MKLRIALLAVVGVFALPAGAWAQSVTITTSTDSHTTFNDSVRTERVDTFLTRITARLDGGATLFDQSFNLAFADAAVQAAVAQATAALTGAVTPAPTILGPTLFSSTTALVNSSTTTTQTPSGSTETIRLEDAIGPATIAIGNLDTGGVPYFVAAGTSNTNIITHTEFFVDRLFLTADTYLTSQTYELIGYPQEVVAGVPEPGSLALLALGVGGMAMWRRRSARRG